ncbi:hypothetical protein AVEN_80733-1 [Araneus ventricosus]|uniref:Uncharacterized protein n=1 Tax=Araneus ventricosus TaxID=182803 RepID=A0A4Y2TAU7_ARAVE|nr:hypothetical protein AVEN_80733-1 [Araneus ventricosus]
MALAPLNPKQPNHSNQPSLLASSPREKTYPQQKSRSRRQGTFFPSLQEQHYFPIPSSLPPKTPFVHSGTRSPERGRIRSFWGLFWYTGWVGSWGWVGFLTSGPPPNRGYQNRPLGGFVQFGGSVPFGWTRVQSFLLRIRSIVL